uniref:Polyprotein-3 n=1 Tax=Tetranychus truncatus TaxID=93132 RepID=A0A3G5ANS2_9ACAR|nr:polyprotein-3 [Tetranychus truncatus]
MVPVVTSVGIGDTPPLALFRDEISAREFANYQVRTGSFKGGPYTKYYFVRTPSGDRDQDGPVSNVINGTILDLVDVEMTGQMDDRHATSIYSTPGEATKHSAQSFFNESFDDLKTIARRYQFYSNFDSQLVANTCFGKVVARIPIRPIIYPELNEDQCSSRLFNAVRSGFIPNIGSGFRFFKGSLRFKFIFDVTFMDQSAKQEHDDLTFMITHVPDQGAGARIETPPEVLSTSYNPQGYAYYGHSTRINPICEIEVPYYSRYEYITPYRITTQNDLDNLGYIDIALGSRVNKSVNLAIQVYYSFGDDARFSSFQGFPSMVYIGDIPQQPQVAIQQNNALTGQMNGWVDKKIDKADKVLTNVSQDFSENLTTALQSSADDFLSHTEVIVEKAMDLFERKMNKQQDRLEEKVDVSTDRIAKKFQASMTESTMVFMENLKTTAEEIVAKSMKQCMDAAGEMGLKSMGLNITEKLVNIVSAVGHIILNPTIKAGILSFVQIVFNLGLIMSDKIQNLFSSLVNIADQAQKADEKMKGQADDKSKDSVDPAMVSSLATVILSAAGLSIGARKSKSIKYASNGLKVFKDFSMASNSFGVWLKNNLSWITKFLQWAHLVDNKMELDNEIVNKYDTMKDWIIETHRILQIPIHRIEADYTMILKVYMLAFRAEEYMAMECSDAGKLPLHYSLRHLSTQICEMRNQLLSSSYSPPIGVEPFVVCLSGPPGFGKSELLNRVSDKLVDDAGYQCPGNTSYVRGFTEYWNNAGMQPCLIYDDVGTEEESMRQFVKELFSMKSRSVFNPNFAHLEDKRRVFNPIAIIMGTNFPFWDVIPSGANSLEALHRRRDALWQVMPAFPGVGNTMAEQFAAMRKKKEAFSESKEQTEFDFSHLKFRLCSNPEAVTLGDAKWHKWVNYDDFYRITLGMFRSHRMKEIKIIKSNLDKAYKKRLNFTDEQESERLRNFFEKVLLPNERTLADLGAFNDPAVTAVVGSINVDDLDFGSALEKAFDVTSQLNKPDDDEMTGQALEQKKKRMNGSEVIEPKDDENTIVDDPRFEQLLATPLKNPHKFPNPAEETEEEKEINEDEIDPKCPHKILLDIKVQNVMYTRDSDEDPGVFRYAPDFDNPIPYPKCLRCAFNTKNGKLYLSNWIKECVKTNLKMPDPSTVPKKFATRPCTTRIPPLTKFQEWRNTIVLRTRNFFMETTNRWKQVLKIIGWIALAATLISGAVALYNHYKKPKLMEGNMDPEKALKACKIINKFNESNDIKKLMKDDPELARQLSRKMLVESGIMAEEDFDGNSYSTSSPGPDQHVYRNSRIKMQRREGKRTYRPLNGQSEQLESIKSMIQTNLGRVFAICDGKEEMSTMVCGLYNRNAFIMRHQIYTFQKLKEQGATIKAFIERWIDGKPQKYEFHFDEYVYDPKSDSELVLVTFPKQMPAFKNILRHLAVETTPVTSSCLMTWRDQKGTINNQNIQISRMNYTQSISSDQIVPYQFCFAEALSYNFGGPGLCGSPIITTSAIPKIVGFHCAGQGDKRGSCQRVYQSEFDVQEGQFMCDSGDLCDDKPMIQLPPNLDVVGVLKKDKLPGFSTKTQLEKSIMFNEIVESTKMPAPLKRINGIDPMEKALQKLEKVPTGFDQTLLKEAYESLSDDLQFQCPPVLSPEETSVLSLEDCFTGIPGLTEFKKINLATSEGYPLNIMGRIDQNKYHFKDKLAYSGKHWLFDYELDNEGYHLKDIHPLLLTERERMMNQRAAIINGYDLGERQFAVLTLKDQKMDIAKALEGKNRIFSCCPIEQSLAVRQYFGHWKAAYMHNRIDDGTAIGIDVNSPEWTQLALELKRHGDHIVTGDYTAFGDTLDKDCVKYAFEAINDWYSYYYGDSLEIEYENKMREALYDELIKMPHIAKNVIFVRSNGIPSGFGLTVEINDLVNKLYMKVAWLALTGASLREMAQHVYYCMYGDDLIMSVSSKYIDQFNFESIRGFLAEHNITFTPASKDETSYKSLPLSESTFLKANFVEHPSSTPLRPIYLNVLPETSVLELLNWQWKGNDPKQFCFEACRAALEHLYPHGRKKFNSIRKKMLSFFVKNRNTLFGPDDMPDLQSFDELDRRFLSQFLD